MRRPALPSTAPAASSLPGSTCPAWPCASSAPSGLADAWPAGAGAHARVRGGRARSGQVAVLVGIVLVALQVVALD